MICECGERLLAAVGEETITTVEGHQLVFRRRTDYVLCPRCLRLYAIAHLRGSEGSEFVALNGSVTDFADLEAQGEDQLPLEDQFG